MNSSSGRFHDLALQVPNPGIGETTEIEGELTAWYVRPGQQIAAGDLLYQITWPGVVVDVSAESAGEVIHLLARLRTHVNPGDEVAVLRAQGGDPD
ncbi:biotin/lipoyl-containing protein [Rubinisphaera margarita]|uniref:biotin/lipoyl-containing protein n=1 Tax=Rubinisphaera margarita TaxID=2909586 RepID=UPI001EE94E17|nr:biotin/lipoyl-containing protein [Rubinisphaera margarita]MCG6157014.1 hypothetical protein [Rubinisphaera margarita]